MIYHLKILQYAIFLGDKDNSKLIYNLVN